VLLADYGVLVANSTLQINAEDVKQREMKNVQYGNVLSKKA